MLFAFFFFLWKLCFLFNLRLFSLRGNCVHFHGKSISFFLNYFLLGTVFDLKMKQFEHSLMSLNALERKVNTHILPSCCHVTKKTRFIKCSAEHCQHLCHTFIFHYFSAQTNNTIICRKMEKSEVKIIFCLHNFPFGCVSLRKKSDLVALMLNAF